MLTISVNVYVTVVSSLSHLHDAVNQTAFIFMEGN